MFDVKGLLDQFLGSQAGNETGQGAQHQRRPGQQPPSNGFDLSRLGQMAQGSFGGVGGGALAGGLAGILLGSKQGRRLAGQALTVGGMAVVGGLAYKAYRDWQAGNAPTASQTAPETLMLPAPSHTPFNPSTEAEQLSLGLTLLRAMIAAAKADGHIDAKEQAGIFAEVDKLNLDAEAKAFVMDELRAPLDIDAVARAARTPEQAAEVYTASLLVIDPDHAAERAYLAMLAARMNLDPKLVEHLDATVAAATEKVPAQTSSPTSVPLSRSL